MAFIFKYLNQKIPILNMLVYLFSFLSIFLSVCSYSQNNTNCTETINKKLEVKEFIQKYEKIKENNSDFMSVFNFLENESKIAFKNKDTLLSYVIAKQKIIEGQVGAVGLTFIDILSIGINYPEKYRQLERLQDSAFIEKSRALIGIKINMELAFQMRKMIKRDQINKVLQYVIKDKIDSLGLESINDDSLNEILLGQIFEQYGYPGLNLVGYESNSVILIFTHMSIPFQIKYIHLVMEAKKNKQFNSETNSLIDRILYRSGKKTLYNTTWSNLSPVETNKEKRNELLKMLNLDIEKRIGSINKCKYKNN